LDHAITSPGYHPYLLCSTYAGMSGAQREAKVDGMFQSTPNVSATHFYAGGNLFHNENDMSCGILRAYDDTIARVYAANPGAGEHMTVNPLTSSMKMVEDTVEVLGSWFGPEGAGGVASIESTDGEDGRIRVKVSNLEMVLCPGVQSFDNVSDVNDTMIVNDIRAFVTEDGGKTVEDHSFYHHRVSGRGDGDAAVHTERMAEWAAAVTNVTSWTEDDGSNVCLDDIITDSMDFSVYKRSLTVVGRTPLETSALIGGLGFSEEDFETCIWYLTYGLALSPMVCSMQPGTEVRTLCKDGTSDLSKCPVTVSSPPAWSSSRRTTYAWIGSIVCMVISFWGVL